MVDRTGDRTGAVAGTPARSHALVAELATAAPAQAAGLLSEIDRRYLDGVELAVLLRAEAGVQAWLQAGMAASMTALAHAPDTVPADADPQAPAARTQRANSYAIEEIALALSVSVGSARWQLSRARFACQQAPACWQAWRRGHLTQPKVWACHDELTDCEPDTVQEFVRRFFDDTTRAADGYTPAERAAADTPYELRDRARRLVDTLDADAAERRAARRRRERRVRARLDRDGLGTLIGTDLPAENVAAAYEHVDALARALRNHGDPRCLDALRADIYTALLAGDHPDLDWPPDTEGPDPDRPPADHNSDAPDDGSDTGAADAPHGSDTGRVTDTRASSSARPGDHAESTPGHKVAVRPVHLVVPYDLLAGGDTPGEVADLGQMPAESMRALLRATARMRSQWALTLVDPTTGRAVIHVRRNWRPAGMSRRPGPGRLVELLLPIDAVHGSAAALDPDGLVPPGLLAGLLGDASHTSTEWCRDSHRRSAHDPTTSQKQFIHARDRHCTFRGCRRRAVACDADHHRPWEQGGPTCPCNLHPLCRRHHNLKHHPHWACTLDASGRVGWHSPHHVTGSNDTHALDPARYQRGP